MLAPLPGYVEVFDLLFVGRHGRGRGGIYRDPRHAHPRLFAGRGRAGHRLWPHQSALSLLRQIVCLLPLFWLLAQLGLDYIISGGAGLALYHRAITAWPSQ